MSKKYRAFRFFLSFVLVVSIVLTGIIPCRAAGTSFKDVPSDAYYAEPVGWAVDKEITKGTSVTTFSPDEGCTRAQCVTFLYRYAGFPATDVDKASKFTDVQSGEYYASAVAWAVQNEITAGTSETAFSPEGKCTRAQIVTFLWRYMNKPTMNDTGTFMDVKSDAYYADAVSWAVEQEITNGTSETTFGPEKTCTRAQIVTFLYRLSKVKEEDPDLQDIKFYETEEGHIVSGILTFEGNSFEGEYVDNELLIMVKSDLDESDVNGMVKPYGGISLGYVKQVGLYQIVFDKSKTLNELNQIISELKKNGSVIEAGLNTVSTSAAQSIEYPDDQWTCKNTNCHWNEKVPEDTNWSFEAINAASARQMVKEYYKEKGTQIPRIKMGIIDGYLYNVKIQDAEELTFEDVYYWDHHFSLKYSDALKKLGEEAKDLETFSRYSHGNHVAGIIGAKADNEVGITGIALDPKLYGCAVTDHGKASDSVNVRTTEADQMRAVAVLIQKCGQEYPAIINYSMGSGKGIPSESAQKGTVSQNSHWMALFLKSILEKKEGDFLIVTSAGNGEAPCKDARYNNEFTCISKELTIGEGKLNCQDVVDRILVVGASNKDFKMEADDSYGSRIDVVAPGEGVYSLIPENTRSQMTEEGLKQFSEGQTVYKKNGTSEAAPHVAGTAALVLAVNPALNGAQLKNRIINSSNILIATPDTNNNYHPMINAANAVATELGKTYTIGSDSDSPVEWSLSSDGKLTITGKGDLNPVQNGKYEWTRWASNITSVEVKDNITGIGNKAFSNCRNLKSIDLAESVICIGENAMEQNKSMESVIIRSTSPDLQIAEGAIIGEENTVALYGYKGSKVEEYGNIKLKEGTYASQYNFRFVPLDAGSSGDDPGTDPDSPGGDPDVSGGTITDSWAGIITSVNNGTYKSKYKVKDTKALDLGKYGVLEMEIVDFDEDELADGSGKAAITWISKKVIKAPCPMNPELETDPSDSSKYILGTGCIGGWEYSRIRAWLQSDLKPLIPSGVQNAIKPVKKYSTSYNTSGEMIPDALTVDDVWIPSCREVGGTGSESKGPVYEKFMDTYSYRIKQKNNTLQHISWFLRSGGSKNGYRYVRNDGGIYSHSSVYYSDYGLAFGFCM